MNQSFEPPPLESHSALGHETTDVRPWSIGLFALALAVMLAAVLPLVVWMFWQLESMSARHDAAPSQIASADVARGPRLQSQPAAELQKFREAENQRLTTYRWIDQEHGVVQIPIERAIELLAVRGLPEPKGSGIEKEPQEPQP